MSLMFASQNHGIHDSQESKKKGARNRSSVLVCRAVRPGGQAEPPASQEGLNRRVGIARRCSTVSADHDGLVRVEGTHTGGVQSGGVAVNTIGTHTLNVREEVARLPGCCSGRN